MEAKTMPRLAEVLGVDGKFSIKCGKLILDCHIDSDGILRLDLDIGAPLPGPIVCYIVNHPESIIRAPRLTEAELSICKAVGAKWVSKDANCDDGTINFWSSKPLYAEGMYNNQTEDNSVVATLMCGRKTLFVSVRPGDCICVEEVSSE